ncbi:MAG: DUF3606 domain-containing protein [Xanthomonadales bacterium]|nr:DUF3606 domain-containing protein [Xanthomonadales bacterium]
MADDPRKTGTPDNDLINLHQSYEVRDWCRSFNCTEQQLRDAVRQVGNSARKVREHLARR